MVNLFERNPIYWSWRLTQGHFASAKLEARSGGEHKVVVVRGTGDNDL
jgi:hypothetical protein